MNPPPRSSFLLCLSAGMLLAAAPQIWAAPPPKPADPKEKPAAPAGGEKLPTNQFEMQQLANEANAAWERGDAKTVVAKLVPYLAACEKLGITEKMDILLYMLGVSYATPPDPDYAKATETLKKYENKFPKGDAIKDVMLLIGKCQALGGDNKGAIGQFEKIKNIPDLREQVLPILAEIYEKDDQAGKAVSTLQDYLKGGYGSTERVNAALRLAKIYFDTDKVDEGIAVLEQVKISPSAADYVIIINGRALDAASKLMEEKPELALRALQAVRRQKEVVRLQKERNEVLRGKIEEWKRKKKDPKFASLAEEGTTRLKQLEELLGQVEKEESYDAVVIYQIGRCYATLHRYWEAELAFRTINEKYPTFANRSSAAFGQIISLFQLKMKKEALDLCWKFLKDFPQTAEADEVSELTVTMAMEEKDFDGAKRAVENVLAIKDKDGKDLPNKNKMMLYKVGIDFELYAFDAARATLDEYRKLFPNDAFKEEVDYRYALTYFFKNDYKNTMEQLNKFLDAYPNSPYLPDANYRLGIVMYGEEQANKTKAAKAKELATYKSNFKRVIDHAEDVIKRFPDSTVLGELYALIGDCYDQMTPAEVEELKLESVDKSSGDAYMNAAMKASNDNVMEYGLEQARTKFQAIGAWKEIQALYEDFVTRHPEHPDRLKGINYICMAISRQATNAEEREQRRGEIRSRLIKEILPNINRPNKEGVEMLLQQLAQAAIPKRKPRPATPPAGAPATPGTETTAPPPPPPPSAPDEDPYDVAVKQLDTQMDEELAKGGMKLNNTGKARMLYTKAQLLKMVGAKRDPADPKKKIDRTPDYEKLLDQIGTEFQPEDLPSTLLAFVGDHLRKRGIVEKATACYNRLLQFFPHSDFLDFAVVGLGDMAYEAKNYAEAEKQYRKAKDEVPGMKYPNALMGLAKSQIAQGNYKDCEAPLTEIVGTKEWKGELTAEALYWLGESSFKLGNFSVSANYYQRIFLSFAKYADWAVKGYIGAIESFMALGQKPQAAAHAKEAKEYLVKRKLEAGPLMQQLREVCGKRGLPL